MHHRRRLQAALSHGIASHLLGIRRSIRDKSLQPWERNSRGNDRSQSSRNDSVPCPWKAREGCDQRSQPFAHELDTQPSLNFESKRQFGITISLDQLPSTAFAVDLQHEVGCNCDTMAGQKTAGGKIRFVRIVSTQTVDGDGRQQLPRVSHHPNPPKSENPIDHRVWPAGSGLPDFRAPADARNSSGDRNGRLRAIVWRKPTLIHQCRSGGFATISRFSQARTFTCWKKKPRSPMTPALFQSRTQRATRDGTKCRRPVYHTTALLFRNINRPPGATGC